MLVLSLLTWLTIVSNDALIMRHRLIEKDPYPVKMAIVLGCTCSFISHKFKSLSEIVWLYNCFVSSVKIK